MAAVACLGDFSGRTRGFKGLLCFFSILPADDEDINLAGPVGFWGFGFNWV